MTSVIILAIESSCDDTAVAVLQDGRILCNKIASQKVHELYGGVVPELASRAHQQHIVPLTQLALKEAGIALDQLSAIAFTAGPGLLGSLMVGTSFAKGLALALDIPLIAIHHMEAHVLAHFIEEPHPAFPFLCLTVSGGHTHLTRMDGPFSSTMLGKTIDDAAGEAFDKAAKMLGLPYPGGPLIDQHARSGNPLAFKFASPQIPELNYSFSGIKTSILYFLQAETRKNPDFITQNLNDLCASVQYTIIRHLMKKLEKAVQQTGIREVALAGGVSANSALRSALIEAGKNGNWNTYIPAFEYCTDNAAMIAIAAYYKFKEGIFSHQQIAPFANANY
ncbi:MAG: tRNA (adenosine(37)-N6)-threonylcarbamoyltransferase complex transferase subunit TsaD [Bacteroidia bacterium]|jgi:N6-L-threonylcarbamoyladenine synthase